MAFRAELWSICFYIQCMFQHFAVEKEIFIMKTKCIVVLFLQSEVYVRYGILMMLSTILLSGCATMNTVRPDGATHPDGATRVYVYPLPVVFAAAKAAARDVGLEVVEEAPDKSFLTARRGVTGWSWGEVVGIYLAPKSPEETKVTIRSLPRLRTNITATNFSMRLHRALPPLLTEYARRLEEVYPDRHRRMAAAEREPSTEEPPAPIVNAEEDLPDRLDLSAFPAVGDGLGLLLAIGVNEYHHLGDVEGGRAAAESFTRTMLDSGSMNPRQTVLLLDDAAEERNRATLANMRSRIRQVSNLADEEDTLIVFFTGHGITIDGEAYLVPQDGGAKDTSIPLSWVKSTMRASAAREKVLILDACHSGAGVLGVTGIEPDMTAATDIVVMTSSRGDEVSFTMDDGKGVFSTYLIEGLSGAADENRDGKITVGELYRYVNERVREWSLREGRTQRPMILPAIPPDVVITRLK